MVWYVPIERERREGVSVECKLVGLELGADDYMTKPFDLREVVARVKD
ncbi:hypothetical protein EMIT07CA2_280007 [Brevibacillus sp. IT-7CA2]